MLNKDELRTWHEEQYPNYFATPGANPFIEIRFLDDEQCAEDEDTICSKWSEKVMFPAIGSGGTIYLIAFIDLTDDRQFDHRCL